MSHRFPSGWHTTAGHLAFFVESVVSHGMLLSALDGAVSSRGLDAQLNNLSQPNVPKRLPEA